MSKLAVNNNLVDKISELIKNARTQILRNVNHTMVVTYFEIGRMIVEDEQSGNKRADYGDKLITVISDRLTRENGKGFSITNIQQMRKFLAIIYLTPQGK